MASRSQLTKSRTGRVGFTLVESLIAAVVLSIAVIGVCRTLSASDQQTRILDQTTTAVALGRELLEEIASKPLFDPNTHTTTPVSTALAIPRSQFTSVGDYNLYSDSGSAMTTLGGSSVDGTDGLTYQRSVTVTLGAKPSGDTTSPASDFAVATVTVTTPSGLQIKLQRVVTNYGFYR